MNTLRLELCWTVRLCIALFAVCVFSLPLHGQDAEKMNENQREHELKVVDSLLYDKIEVEKLRPWILKYQALGGDFRQQNSLAFQFSSRGILWWERMSLMAIDPQTTEESQKALAHLASAYYLHHYKQDISIRCLGDREPRIVAGMLKLLRMARELRPDGSDRDSPTSGPLDPQRFPKHIAAVLEQHPILAIDVAQTLEVYGPLALKEAGVLFPLLMSQDEAVVAAAQSAIRRMDPQGVAQVFHLKGEPLTPEQLKWIRDYLREPPAHLRLPPVVDLRESDGSPQSLLSQRFEELRRYLRFMRSPTYDNVTDYNAKKEIAFHFCHQNRSMGWWRTFGSAYWHQESDLRIYFPDDTLLHFASALYSTPGSQAELVRLLQDEDYRIAYGAMNLIVDMRLYKPGSTSYAEGGLVDPEVMPAHILKVLDRHPHRFVDVAGCLGVYGAHASSQAEALVPFLLSNDTTIVQRMQIVITKTNPDLAKHLEITMVVSDVDFDPNEERRLDEAVDGPPQLMPRQRELIEAHLKKAE